MTVPSDPIQPGVPAQRTRPGTVTAAGYLLIVIGLLSLVGVITALASYSTIHDAFVDVYKGTPAEDSAGAIAMVTSGVTIAISVLFGIGAFVLAPLVLKGKQAARIITWVVAGLLLCCQGGSLAGSGLSGSSFGQSNTNGVDTQELSRRLVDDLPDWVRPVELSTSAVMLIVGIVVAILLALPASHPFFRKQPIQEWTPPAYPTV
jgi:hypothetical protein